MLTPWKESYDQLRQHIKKQRHYFVNKGPSSQSYGFSSSRVWRWELDYKKKLSTKELMLLNCGVGEDSWESLGLQGDPTSQSYRKSVLNIDWKDWCWSWNSNPLTTWCKELTHLKRPWCWERLKGMTEDEMFGWHHQLDGHEFEQAPGVGDGQGGLVCCSPWGLKELDTTERLNWSTSLGRIILMSFATSLFHLV